MTLNAKEIEAIRKRTEAATPGPWLSAKLHGEWCAVNEERRIVAEMYQDCDVQDADFIAHAREDVPKLLAEIERLSRMLNIYASALREVESVNEYYSGTIAAKALDEGDAL